MQEVQVTHQPKGGMCATCKHRHRKCDHLSFESMPVIKRWPDGLLIVKCTSWERE